MRRTPANAPILRLAGAAVLASALWGCPPASQVPEGEAAQTGVVPAAFVHSNHVGAERKDGSRLGCGDCHASTAEGAWVPMRPGMSAHAPCDTCHEADFYKEPGALCGVCHNDQLDPKAPPKGDGATLLAFPRRSIEAQLVGKFSHARHLDEGKVRDPAGKALRCDSCHAVDDESPYASIPTHGACAPCHAPDQVAASKAPHSLDDCAGCHEGGGPGRARRFARDNDVRFTHAKHRVAPDGSALVCTHCHQAVVSSDKATDRVTPQMAVCSACHEDPSKVKDPKLRISDNCGLCHIEQPQKTDLPGNHTAYVPLLGPDGQPVMFAQAAPDGRPVPSLRELLPSPFDPAPTPQGATTTSALKAPGQVTPAARPTNPNVRPQSHTPFFRRRHEQAASDASALCSQCHDGLSGSRRDNCQECHAVMRPKSHTLRFRSVAHGREAASDPRACATCHEVDYCSECHAQRPPSHRADFANRHDRVARLNPRSCTTCHTFESTCVECHRGVFGDDPFSTTGGALHRRPR